jgi:hypothetical protein
VKAVLHKALPIRQLEGQTGQLVGGHHDTSKIHTKSVSRCYVSTVLHYNRCSLCNRLLVNAIDCALLPSLLSTSRTVCTGDRRLHTLLTQASPWLHLLDFFQLLVEQRASTVHLQLTLFWAVSLTSFQVVPAFFTGPDLRTGTRPGDPNPQRAHWRSGALQTAY